jgi:hypothetical protein
MGKLCFPKNVKCHLTRSKACLSSMATLFFEDIGQSIGLIVIGQPSSGKTAMLESFLGKHQMSIPSDSLTPASFVSRYGSASDAELDEIDLLPLSRFR